VNSLRRTPPLVFAMAALATGLVVASSVLVKGIRRGNDTITVTGSSTERISSPEVEKVAAVAQQIGELVGQGVPLTINDPAYTYTRLSEKRVDMLTKATHDARQAGSFQFTGSPAASRSAAQ
jgi:hypothetical protein